MTNHPRKPRASDLDEIDSLRRRKHGLCAPNNYLRPHATYRAPGVGFDARPTRSLSVSSTSKRSQSLAYIPIPLYLVNLACTRASGQILTTLCPDRD
ncbi:hypothetical protein RSAG8_05233, partial [Rhizoctonia solani AG-8 WAC10335]